jgi:prolyl-tRNA synthetase
MKLSNYYWQTYKENPADADIPSHRLMMRAGLIYKSGAGLYSYLPMGLKSIRKVEKIIREELDGINAHELVMTMVTPAELWKESGRWDLMEQMLKAKDKNDKEICLSPTNEETVTDIFRKTVFSYKQLPVTLYQINTKYRDEIRPRFGLMRCREFVMKDAYSFHDSWDSLRSTYEDMYRAYSNTFKRLGLKFFAVEADAGSMGSGENRTHEFQVLADSGEDLLVYDELSGYAANIEKAQTKRAKLNFHLTTESVQEVATPGKSSIEDVCQLLKIEQYQSLKCLVYYTHKDKKDHFIIAILLGDDQLNEIKLANALDVKIYRPALDSEISKLGLIKGFIGPKADTKIDYLWDTSIDQEAAYVVGASKLDLHLKNFIPKRDFKGTVKTVDLRLAREGDLSLKGNSVVLKKGIEVGHIFELGQKYTESMKASVVTEAGKSLFPYMGCYGIGVTRTVAAAIEQCHDDSGIIWPKSIAPFDFHFISITKSDEAKAFADKIYEDLKKQNLDILYDDRKVGPGFKFKDADLLGIPVQLIYGERDYQEDQSLVIQVRKTGEKKKVKLEKLVEELKSAWEQC